MDTAHNIQDHFTFTWAILQLSQCQCGWGWGFLWWWSLSAMWAGHSIFSSTTTGDVWMVPSFLIWDYMLHVRHFLCHITNCGQHQWVISSSISIGLLFSIASYLSFLLTFFCLGCYCCMWLYFSTELVISFSRNIANWCRVAISNDKSTQQVSKLIVFLFYLFLSWL